MERLERDILETERAIGQMSSERVRFLDRALRDLTPEQRGFAKTVLNRLRETDHLPRHYLHMLEHFVERWATHSLPTKLVLVGRLTELAKQMGEGSHEGAIVNPLTLAESATEAAGDSD